MQLQCFPNCCATGKCDNRTTRWIKQIKISVHPKLINKENSRSEIWRYFGYKTDDKSERTDLTAPVCKRCYRPKSCCHRNTSNLFKHLSLTHPDLFRELRDRQVSASFINSDLIWTFIYNWSTHIQMWYSKLKRACVTRQNQWNFGHVIYALAFHTIEY